MNITCTYCHNISELKGDDEDFINSMLAIGLKVVMIECPVCHEKTAFSTDENINIPKQDFIVKCPIPNCNGWVTHIVYPEHNEDFYGCGECSSIWKTKKELEKFTSKQKNKFQPFSKRNPRM